MTKELTEMRELSPSRHRKGGFSHICPICQCGSYMAKCVEKSCDNFSATERDVEIHAFVMSWS